MWIIIILHTHYQCG